MRVFIILPFLVICITSMIFSMGAMECLLSRDFVQVLISHFYI